MIVMTKLTSMIEMTWQSMRCSFCDEDLEPRLWMKRRHVPVAPAVTVTRHAARHPKRNCLGSIDYMIVN
jgi:hypothetical protein